MINLLFSFLSFSWLFSRSDSGSGGAGNDVQYGMWSGELRRDVRRKYSEQCAKDIWIWGVWCCPSSRHYSLLSFLPLTLTNDGYYRDVIRAVISSSYPNNANSQPERHEIVWRISNSQSKPTTNSTLLRITASSQILTFPSSHGEFIPGHPDRFSSLLYSTLSQVQVFRQRKPHHSHFIFFYSLPRALLRGINVTLAWKFTFQTSTKARGIIEITTLSHIPGQRIEKYLGNLNFFFIRETTSIKEVRGEGEEGSSDFSGS